MLVFVGMGIRGEESLTLEGLRELREADEVYAELYTSPLPQLDLKKLEEMAGKKISVLGRREVEEGEELLKASAKKRVVLLVPGDPMIATTHVGLRLAAASRSIPTKVVHSSSIVSAVAGLTGLQSYKFGQSATVPLPDLKSIHPYEVLGENTERGLHTLLFLDVRHESGAYLSAPQAIQILLQLEEQEGRGYFTGQRLVVVIARAGADDCLVRGDRAANLLKQDFGPVPHVLVVPGRLHFLEAGALEVFAGVPEDVVRELEG